MTNCRIGLAACLLLAGHFHPVAAEEAVHLVSGVEVYPLGLHLEYAYDPEGAWSIEDVSTGPETSAFQPVEDAAISFGLTRGAYWFRFTLENDTVRSDEWFISLANPRMNRVTLYEQEGARTLAVHRSGTAMPHGDWEVRFRHPTFRVRLAPGESRTCYLRLQIAGSMRFTLSARTAKAFVEHNLAVELVFGMLYGGMVAMALYNGFVWATLRDRNYLYYLLFIVGFICYQASLDGTAYQYVWPNWSWWTVRSTLLFFGLTLGLAVLFSKHFLDSRTHAPYLDRVLSVLLLVCGVVALGSFTDVLAINLAAHLLGLAGPIAILFTAARCWHGGFQPARILVIAWAALVCGSMLLALLGLGLLPQLFITEYGLQIGFAAAIVLFSLALAERIRNTEEESRLALERIVAERTRELRSAQDNIKILGGLIPICSQCKKIRDDRGYWNQLETYIRAHSEAEFSHSICPDCATRLYPDQFADS